MREKFPLKVFFTTARTEAGGLIDAQTESKCNEKTLIIPQKVRRNIPRNQPDFAKTKGRPNMPKIECYKK